MVYGLRELYKDVKCFTIAGAYHELLIEKDKYRIPVITTILEYFNNINSNKIKKEDY